jgi:hypothetical protein
MEKQKTHKHLEIEQFTLKHQWIIEEIRERGSLKLDKSKWT